jgi:hypothetical protein
MESGPVLTIADLRQASNTNWCQDVELSFAFRRGERLKVQFALGLVLPKALFKFQLQQAVFEFQIKGRSIRHVCECICAIRIFC